MSYEAETTMAKEMIGKYTVYCFAGSYNPGNQPEYGNDWEYYDVSVYIESPSMGILIETKKFTSKEEAKKYFNRMKNKYSTRN